jgi:hypothetical protein
VATVTSLLIHSDYMPIDVVHDSLEVIIVCRVQLIVMTSGVLGEKSAQHGTSGGSWPIIQT